MTTGLATSVLQSASAMTAAAEPPREFAAAAVEDLRAPRFSLVIPVHNGGEAFRRCLESLPRERAGRLEILVVDDASTDGSGERAAERGLRVIRRDRRDGPAAARNAGARAARGELLFFLDADCLLHADALDRADQALTEDPGLTALFGSYDDRPDDDGLVSQFKNLLHHWTHQHGAEAARTFWAGCGVVRRDEFLALDGFDERRYPEPSIEDIELGYRLSERGGRIRLVKDLEVRHLKRWTLGSWLRTDLFRRGIPWTELLLEGRGRGGQLNLDRRGRFTVLAGVAAVAALLAAVFASPDWRLPALATAALATTTMAGSSWGFYRLLRRRRGAPTAIAALPLHALYCCCCAVSFAGGAVRHLTSRRQDPVSRD